MILFLKKFTSGDEKLIVSVALYFTTVRLWWYYTLQETALWVTNNKVNGTQCSKRTIEL